LVSIIKGSAVFARVEEEQGALICDDLESWFEKLEFLTYGLFYSQKTGKTYKIEEVKKELD
jgi:hypothetical protein